MAPVEVPFKGEKASFSAIGLSWQMTTKTVLRTGYGIFYDSMGVIYACHPDRLLAIHA